MRIIDPNNAQASRNPDGTLQSIADPNDPTRQLFSLPIVLAPEQGNVFSWKWELTPGTVSGFKSGVMIRQAFNGQWVDYPNTLQSRQQTVSGLINATKAVMYAEFVSDAARLIVNINAIDQTGSPLASGWN